MRYILLILIFISGAGYTAAQNGVDLIFGEIGYAGGENSEVIFSFGIPVIDILTDDSTGTITGGVPPVFVDEVSTSSKEVPRIEGVSVFPNPAGDYINIGIPDSRLKHTLTMFDQTGRILLNIDFDSGAIRDRIDIGEFPSGQYLIQIVNAEEAMVLFKIVKY